jgi:16S rRNA (cytosine967-C5)-methyltransferase
VTAPAPGANVRAAAARVLSAVRFDGVSLKVALPAALAEISDVRDRALCEAICFETARWCLRYERIVGKLLQRPLPSSARVVQALLLTGLAQLDAMGLADYAAISSTAEAARLLRQPRHVGLVNAVLRRYQRERDALHAQLEDDPVARHAHPAWLIETLRRDWGSDADDIMQQNNREAAPWLRVNLAQRARDAYRIELAEAGIQTAICDYAPAALQCLQGISPTRLPGWDAGLVSVQDLSAQLSAAAVDAQPGDRVLDACAAPGGKLAHIGELGGDGISLLGIDIDERRVRRIRDNLIRLDIPAGIACADATSPQAWWDGKPYHRILLDAPCSGTGVIRRQPDIKLHRRAADIAGLVALQARLLDALWPLLRAGGRLVYATCSVLKDENERQMENFLTRHPDASPLSLPEYFGRQRSVGRQRRPGDDAGDGFFHAVLQRRA